MKPVAYNILVGTLRDAIKRMEGEMIKRPRFSSALGVVAIAGLIIGGVLVVESFILAEFFSKNKNTLMNWFSRQRNLSRHFQKRY